MMPSKVTSRRTILTLAGTVLASGCVGKIPRGQPEDSSKSSTTGSGAMASTGDPAPEGSWPQFGHDAAHTGYNPTMDATEPSVTWSTELDGVLTTPTVVGDTVYVTRGKPTGDGPIATAEAYALDSGSRRWSESLGFGFSFHAPLSDHRPIYQRGTLFFNMGNGVAAFNPTAAKREWTAQIETASDPPVVASNAIYIAGRKALYCLNDDGTTRWRYPPAESTPTENDRGHHENGFVSISAPAVGDDAVYLLVDGTLVALALTDGSERWRHESNIHSGSVVLAEDALVSAGHDHLQVVTLDGTARWSTGEHGQEIGGIRPAVANGTVYLAGLKGKAAAYTLESGEKQWRTQFGPRTWSQGTIPTVTNGAMTVIDVADGSIVIQALDPSSGDTLWTRSQLGERGRGPVPAHGRYVATAQPLPDNSSKTISSGIDVTSTLWAVETSS